MRAVPTMHDLIQRYKFFWEVWPEWIPAEGHQDKTGFDLELLGTQYAISHAGEW